MQRRVTASPNPPYVFGSPHDHTLRLPPPPLRFHAGVGAGDRVCADPRGIDGGFGAAAAGERHGVRRRGWRVARGRAVAGVLFEKGASYYFHSHAFLTKFALFIIVGLVSIVPTMEFLSWRGALRAGQVPAMAANKRKLVTAIIHGELASIVVIVPCAAIMARGGWI